MKQLFFVKFAPQIKKLTGCSRSTEILGKLEYWFSKYPDGFYKFIEPCSHRLYREGDSWTEELDCDRKSFSSSFDRVAIRYKSRRAFEQASDKFQNKMYASFYDRDTNQTYFLRNHKLANETLASILPVRKKVSTIKDYKPKNVADSLNKQPLRNGKISRSYIEAKNTSKELLKNNSHASDEIIKKMIDTWTTIVEEGRGHIELNTKRIAFLKQAFKDKFDSCLEKWKKFCHDIARSKFLMGEKTAFRANLDWVLKFDSIQKIQNGNYGIGDREPKQQIATIEDLHEEIKDLEESDQIKNIRYKLLNLVGNAHYISWFKPIKFEIREEGTLAMISPSGFTAEYLEINYGSELFLTLASSDPSFNRLILLANGDSRIRKCFERENKAGVLLSNNEKTWVNNDISTLNREKFNSESFIEDFNGGQMNYHAESEQWEDLESFQNANESYPNVNYINLEQGRGVLEFIPV